MASEEKHKGKVVEVIGPVVDIEFEEGHLPLIHSAVRTLSRRCSSTSAKGASGALR
jgi:F-type H+-transporting ATPase subunit beta